MSGELTFDAGRHEYAIAGVPVPGVTNVMSETVGVSWKADDWFLQRGQYIHAAAAFIVRGIEFECDSRFVGRVDAVRKFIDFYKPSVLYVEKPIASKLYQYAGTPDMICQIDGATVIPDWKNSLDVERVKLQCGGYSIAAKESLHVTADFGMGVELHDDGTYKATEMFNLKRSRNEFLALLTVYRIKERLKCLTKKEMAA